MGRVGQGSKNLPFKQTYFSIDTNKYITRFQMFITRTTWNLNKSRSKAKEIEMEYQLKKH